MLVTLEKIEKINHNISSFWFSKPATLDYIAGQYIEMKLPHPTPDDRGIKRWFTLSSAPTEPLISITTKLNNPSSSFKNTLFGLKPGFQVMISNPMGDFVLPKDITRPIVYVIGGVGVTPVRSMVKWLIDTNEKRQVKFIYAAQGPADLVFKGMLTSYSDDFTAITGQPLGTQKLNAKLILDSVANTSNNPLIYVSGPEPLVESLIKDLTKTFSQAQLIGDYFPGYIKV